VRRPIEERSKIRCKALDFGLTQPMRRGEFVGRDRRRKERQASEERSQVTLLRSFRFCMLFGSRNPLTDERVQHLACRGLRATWLRSVVWPTGSQ
jgi:hypothetical protein